MCTLESKPGRDRVRFRPETSLSSGSAGPRDQARAPVPTNVCRAHSLRRAARAGTRHQHRRVGLKERQTEKASRDGLMPFWFSTRQTAQLFFLSGFGLDSFFSSFPSGLLSDLAPPSELGLAEDLRA